MADIVLEHVRKCYGDHEAIRDLSLEIRDREFFVILGESGAGKTTTLMMLCTLLPLAIGSVFALVPAYQLAAQRRAMRPAGSQPEDLSPGGTPPIVRASLVVFVVVVGLFVLFLAIVLVFIVLLFEFGNFAAPIAVLASIHLADRLRKLEKQARSA